MVYMCVQPNIFLIYLDKDDIDTLLNKIINVDIYYYNKGQLLCTNLET